MRKSDTERSPEIQVPDRRLVRGRRRTLCLDRVGRGGGFVVGDGGGLSSARSIPSTTFFSGAYRFLGKLENPGTTTIICPLYRWVKLTAAVVLAAWGASLGSGVPVGRERSSMGGPPGLQALFCSFVKLSVSSLEQVNQNTIVCRPCPPMKRRTARRESGPGV